MSTPKRVLSFVGKKASPSRKATTTALALPAQKENEFPSEPWSKGGEKTSFWFALPTFDDDPQQAALFYLLTPPTFTPTFHLPLCFPDPSAALLAQAPKQPGFFAAS